jgi:hypothetical protein
MATPSGGGRPPDTRARGQVLAYERKDGLTSWYLRVRAYGSRHRINLGTELDGWTLARARIELQNVLAKIQPAFGSRRHRSRRGRMTRPFTSLRLVGWLVAGRPTSSAPTSTTDTY